jgi:hypothetical protein
MFDLNPVVIMRLSGVSLDTLDAVSLQKARFQKWLHQPA